MQTHTVPIVIGGLVFALAFILLVLRATDTTSLLTEEEIALDEAAERAASVPPSEQAQAMSQRPAPEPDALRGPDTFSPDTIRAAGEFIASHGTPLRASSLDAIPIASRAPATAPSPSPEADAEARLLPCRCGAKASFGIKHVNGVWSAKATCSIGLTLICSSSVTRRIENDGATDYQATKVLTDNVIYEWNRAEAVTCVSDARNAAARQPVADAAPLYDERELGDDETLDRETDVIHWDDGETTHVKGWHGERRGDFSSATKVVRRTPRQPVTEPAAVAASAPVADACLVPERTLQQVLDEWRGLIKRADALEIEAARIEARTILDKAATSEAAQ